MDNLFTLLLGLGVALLAMVLLLEKFGKPVSEDQQRSLSRWILPAFAALLVLQLLAYCAAQ